MHRKFEHVTTRAAKAVHAELYIFATRLDTGDELASFARTSSKSIAIGTP